jgi:hypothetical protein
MTDTGAADTVDSMTNPQSLHREAVVQLEKSVEHHRQAASFHEAGDTRQATVHGTMAFDRAAHAVEISGRAMFVEPQVHRIQKEPRTLSWDSLVIATQKIWRASHAAWHRPPRDVSATTASDPDNQPDIFATNTLNRNGHDL